MKKYQIIYADPPWSYYNDSDALPNCTTIKGMRRPPYPVMSSNSIKQLAVKDVADTDSILFIWTTDYHLKKCLDIIESWGFEYKTVGFIWNKQVQFMGAYTLKSGLELCLIGTRGESHRLVKCHNVNSLIESKRTRHSEKPDEVRDRIVRLMGDLPRIELFARHKVEGWDCWGNEVESDIEL